MENIFNMEMLSLRTQCPYCGNIQPIFNIFEFSTGEKQMYVEHSCCLCGKMLSQIEIEMEK